jgi:pimeloyl-ACP methyl ester carboxylesterase
VQAKTVTGFEFTVDSQAREMLATKLVKQGYRVIAVDLRSDLTVTLPDANPKAGSKDPAFGDGIGNVDHGWSVPIVQELLKDLIAANPNQDISLVGHSLGYTVIQDALRRLFNDFKAGRMSTNPFAHLRHVILASGAAHGVSGGTANCGFYKTMRASVNCEMGDWQATAFNKLLDGPEDLYTTPCADGSFAYGQKDQCGGKAVSYTTITMKDPDGGKLQDEFVSEAASRLSMDKTTRDSSGKITVSAPACVDNHLIELTDFDSSGFFMDGLPGFLANHFGSVRSDNGMKYISDKLATTVPVPVTP